MLYYNFGILTLERKNDNTKGGITMEGRTQWEKAKEFADLHGVEIQHWMLWGGWDYWVGCDVCKEMGKSAPCWGLNRCHGYENGCGCKDCSMVDEYHDKTI